jgi:hypothetical protein
MSKLARQHQRLLELAHLPPGDPRRRVLDQEIASMDAQSQQFWRGLLVENDRIFAQIGEVPIPVDLEERLLRLPDSPLPADPWWRQATALQLGWISIAVACALVALAVGGVVMYVFAPPPAPRPLADALAMAITRDAISYHQTSAVPEILGPNAAQVYTALKAKDLSFPIMVLEPQDPLVLQGAGICTIDGLPAAYTRWQAGDLHYTLYQFDGARIGAPASFADTTESEANLWHDNFHPRVVIWPGPAGRCTWALAMDSDSAKNEFRSSY